MAALLAAPGINQTDDIQDTIPALTVFAGRAGQDTPVPHTVISEEELKAKAAQTSVPMALDMQPSVVSTNEGGTGAGYSQIRIRGVAGGQTSVSLNGISLNGAEDGEVFWVNIPALGKYLSSIQVQRGLGTSACGPGAFGASINMATDSAIETMSAEYSYGSFNTHGLTVQAPFVRTAIGKGQFSAGGAFSYLHTNGYIRNAYANVQSALGLLGYDTGKDRFTLTFLYGLQHSGITWEGTPLEQYNINPRYNPAGEYTDESGNIQYYDNQSDNYRQLHFQLNWKHNFTNKLKSSTTLHYTNGYGYYEQYRQGFMSNGNDAVTKDALDNNLFVLRSDLTWQNNTLAVSGGLYASLYSCQHLGESWLPSRADDILPWYSNDALKYETDAYIRAEWSASQSVALYGEVQARAVHHDMTGPDEYGQNLNFARTWVFANPRLGITCKPYKTLKFMASAAAGHREPTRADLQASADVKPETMLDLELSCDISWSNAACYIGLYDMEYFDMLLETGRINDAGYVIKENTPRAWRRGVEFSGRWSPASRITGTANLTLSVNRIKHYTAYLDNYTADWEFIGQTSEEYHGTSMLLSPSAIAGASLKYSPDWMNGGIALKCKYVGRQYWDNTSCADRMVPAYATAGLSAAHIFNFRKMNLTISAEANNLLNSHYYAYAWVWRAIVDGEQYQTEGVFPQAPFNASLSVKIAF